MVERMMPPGDLPPGLAIRSVAAVDEGFDD